VHELSVLLLVVAAAMAVTAVAVPVIGPLVKGLEKIALAGAVLTILFVMAFVGAEVAMRYLFNAPIPGHLEGSELLAPIIVFLAISYTQSTHGHVGMDLVLDAVSPGVQRVLRIVTLVISIVACAILAYFSARQAHQLWLYDDVTMSPPYFKTWPAAAAIPLGYTLISLRMWLQALNLMAPERYPTFADEEDHFSMNE
jgi:TRAP-type C4-dicarboxylate transport system permease small subunit